MQVRVIARQIGIGFMLAGLAFGLGACGVRGSLDAPPGAKAAGTAKSAEASGTQPDSAAPPKPHEDFFLDRLIR